MSSRPIAVFDSGLGGLSVVRRLRASLPAEDVVYFGDTARVPYGTKSQPTVVKFALEAARFLLQFEPKVVVAACNTASALALDDLKREMPVPVVGVVEPGAQAAIERARGGLIGVIGTEATIESGAYPRAIRARAPRQEVLALPCPLLVPLVEEGRPADDPLVRLAVEGYLRPFRERGVSVLVLGCTHYPLLAAAVIECLGPDVNVVDSGDAAAGAVRDALARVAGLSGAARPGSMRCYVSDNPARFRRIGTRFLSEEIDYVELVEPERYISPAEMPA